MANLHIEGSTEIGDTGVTLDQFLTQYNQKRLPHYIEVATTHSEYTKYIQLGRPDDHPQYGKTIYTSPNCIMHEYYGGVMIRNIENYYLLMVEVNAGGNGNSQMNGGIYLWNETNKTYDPQYNTAWREQILMPHSNNYIKTVMNKFIYVGDRTGDYVICALLSTYNGDNIGWNVGYGDDGTTMRVVGILK